MLERWTRGVLRFRLVVLAGWLVVLVAGALASARLPGLLANSFDVPGTESDRAGRLLAAHFDERPDGAFAAVFQVRRPDDRAVQARLKERVARAGRVVPSAHVGRYGSGGGLVWVELRTRLDLQRAKGYTDDLRRALAAQPGPRALVTGQPAIQHDLDPVFASDLRRGEAIALPVALLVLVAVLGLSLAVAIPFLFAACTIAATLGAVYLVAHELSMVTYVTNLVELIGLGLAIDYSLLVVHRFREEVERGLPVEDAVVRTQATAGRAVVFSGLAVAIGLALLLFLPVPLLRSMGVGGFLIPLASVAAALTLQPVLLALLGTRGRLPRAHGRFWERLTRTIMARPVAFLVAGVALLLALAAPALSLKLTPGAFSALPGGPEAMHGYDVLGAGIGRGIVTPTHVVVDAGAPGRARDADVRAATDRLVDAVFHDPETLYVATGERVAYVDNSAQYRRVIVAGRHEYGDAETKRFVTRLRERLIPGARFPHGVRVEAGGAPPQGVDFVARSYAAFPWLAAGVLTLTFLILLRAFRSLLLPLKAVVLNALSVAAVYGVLSLAFDRVEAWIPVFLFATLFGLSMDYEVFIVSRMREAWDELHDNTAAVALGLQRTGRIVTAAAAIMIAAFSGFLAGRVEPLRQFGLGLALAVLLDVTIVRALLVPSLMAILGRWNWWLPDLRKR